MTMRLLTDEQITLINEFFRETGFAVIFHQFYDNDQVTKQEGIFKKLVYMRGENKGIEGISVLIEIPNGNSMNTYAYAGEVNILGDSLGIAWEAKGNNGNSIIKTKIFTKIASENNDVTETEDSNRIEVQNKNTASDDDVIQESTQSTMVSDPDNPKFIGVEEKEGKIELQYEYSITSSTGARHLITVWALINTLDKQKAESFKKELEQSIIADTPTVLEDLLITGYMALFSSIQGIDVTFSYFYEKKL